MISQATNAAGNRRRLAPAAFSRQAAADPVDPIHDYHFPIPPFKQPPAKDDFPENRRRRKPKDSGQERQPPPREREGRIDDYA